MGTDIHAFVEYEKYDCYWSLTDCTFNIPRDYRLFNFLALGDGGITDELPYPPRGLPEDLSEGAKSYFYRPAQEIAETLQWTLEEGEEFDAEDYAKDCGQVAVQEFLRHGLLLDLDLYSHSWLNVAELKEVLAYGKLTTDDLAPEFAAVFAAMERLAKNCGETGVRLVFGFDG
jgi:hypothetical protein